MYPPSFRAVMRFIMGTGITAMLPQWPQTGGRAGLSVMMKLFVFFGSGSGDMNLGFLYYYDVNVIT